MQLLRDNLTLWTSDMQVFALVKSFHVFLLLLSISSNRLVYWLSTSNFNACFLCRMTVQRKLKKHPRPTSNKFHLLKTFLCFVIVCFLIENATCCEYLLFSCRNFMIFYPLNIMLNWISILATFSRLCFFFISLISVVNSYRYDWFYSYSWLISNYWFFKFELTPCSLVLCIKLM